MARRAKYNRKHVLPDARYQSELVSNLINKIMMHGQKTTSERIVYSALAMLEQQGGQPAVTVLEQAIRNATPLLEVKPRRVGGATYQVPVEVRRDRGQTLALRWLIKSARLRGGKSMEEKLGAELLDASKEQGATIKKREDTHKMAEANRAFAHYRW